MSIMHVVATLITLASVFSYINHRFVRLPTTIGVMFIALVTSVLMVVLGETAEPVRQRAHVILGQIDFGELLLHGMLALLLFAGALHIDLEDLRKQWPAITFLASIGTVISTFLVAGMTYFALSYIGAGLPFIYCMVFGALISPTDPIAVIGILKSANAPKTLEIQMAAESLFNDGLSVVIFLVVLALTGEGSTVSIHLIAELLFREVGGAIVVGLVIGYVAYRMLKGVDQYQVEVPLTLAVATGTYALAESLHMSAPIAVVVAGLLVGNHGRYFGMSDITREHLDGFWEMVDEILNAVLFVLIGLEVLVMPMSKSLFVAAAVVIPITLLSRLVSVGGIITLLRRRYSYARGTIRVLTWGGLRGGISVALALSLPSSDYRTFIIAITYAVVIFSIAVQGLTVGTVVRRTSA